MESPFRRLNPLWILIIAMPLIGIGTALLATRVARNEPLPTPLPTPALNSALVGQAAPNFALELKASDALLRLSSLRGRLVFLNFWATWCEPCRREFPAFAVFGEAHPEVRILAVNVGETAEQIDAFLLSNDLAPDDVDILYDSDFALQDAYAVDYLPSTFVIDARGQVVAFHYGEITEADLAGYVVEFG